MPPLSRSRDQVAERASVLRGRVLGCGLKMVVLCEASSVYADVSARRLHEAGAHRVLESSSARGDRVELLARITPGEPMATGLVPLTRNWAVFRGERQELERVFTAHRAADWFFAPAKRLAMDLAGPTLSLPSAVGDFGVDGAGVVIGVVDTGLDFQHPAFLHEDGTTRVAWLLSFGQTPRGVHAAMEEDMGCTAYGDCAIFSGADIDQLRASGMLAELPADSIGHGSHVASIAAGRETQFPGVAPGAELIIVQAAGAAGSASDAGILAGVRFIFDRASEMGMPAVVNLSLGSSFGAHDGTSALEQVIDQLSTGPGRVVVVASGNDAGLFDAGDARYPDPLGIHAEAIVPAGSEVRVPVHITRSAEGALDGYIFFWISSAPGDELSLALDNGRGVVTGSVPPGETGYSTSADLGDSDDYELVILNGADEDFGTDIQPGSLVLGISGTIQADREFELVLTGHGNAKLWVEGGGDLASQVLLPRARAGGTVSIPATAMGVISVGASVNRETWIDFSGAQVDFPLGPPGSRAYFSGSGPSQLGSIEPDVLAPGGQVIAAMAGAADPRDDPATISQFASRGACPDPQIECFVVDDRHGVSMGTSMAAPMVAGAVALLLQRDPTLEAHAVRDLLRAGAASPRPGGAVVGDGSGILDIRAALVTQDLGESGALRLPHADSTRLVPGDVFLQPGGRPLELEVILRDASDEPAGGFALDRLAVTIDGPASVGSIELLPGLLRFWLEAQQGVGRKAVTVRVSFDGAPLVEKTIPIEVDSSVYRDGFTLGGGNCQATPSRPPPVSWLLALGGLGLCLGRARRRRTVAFPGC
jgi:subtilisin family serine protease